MWEALAEQLAQTREYAIGRPFAVDPEVSTDEELLAALFRWALSMTVGELDRHVRVLYARCACSQPAMKD